MSQDALRTALTAGLLSAVPLGLLAIALRRRLRAAIVASSIASVMVVASQFFLVWVKWRTNVGEPGDMGVAVGALFSVVILLLGLALSLGTAIGIVIHFMASRAADRASESETKSAPSAQEAREEEHG